MEILEIVRKTLTFSCEVQAGDGITVGVSGGADSVYLLLALSALREELGLSLYAVHLNHGIRGTEADEDEAYVRKLCDELSVPLFSFYRDIPGIAEKKHRSLEDTGRQERYQIFEKVRWQTGSSWIAVAHHRDDQAETLLMHLFRGSGLHGAGGMRYRNGKIIRPLLDISKKDLTDALIKSKRSWRTDRTNFEADVTRNRLRLQILPAIEELQPEASRHLASVAGDFAAADRWLASYARKLLAGEKESEPADAADKLISLLQPRRVEIPDRLLDEGAPIDLYLIRAALSSIGHSAADLTRQHFTAMLSLTGKPGSLRLALPHGLVAEHAYDRLILSEAGEPSVAFSIRYRIFAYEGGADYPQNSCVNWFDYDRLPAEAVLRTRRTGDVIKVTGTGQQKKLADCMIDRKIPAAVRGRYPVLASENHILWVPGVRMDETLKVGPATRRILEARLICKTKTGLTQERANGSDQEEWT